MHNLNLLLSLLLSPSSLKISNNSNSVSLSPSHLDRNPAQLLSQQIVVNLAVNVITIKSNLGFDYEYMTVYIHEGTKEQISV